MCRAAGYLIGATAFFLAPLSFAHHGFPAHYYPDRYITIEGTVKQFDFVNPHAVLHIDGMDDDTGDRGLRVDDASASFAAGHLNANVVAATLSRSLGWTGCFGGLGGFTLEGIQSQDFIVVQAMVSLGSFMYVIALLLTDISYTLVDPRIRLD